MSTCYEVTKNIAFVLSFTLSLSVLNILSLLRWLPSVCWCTTWCSTGCWSVRKWGIQWHHEYLYLNLYFSCPQIPVLLGRCSSYSCSFLFLTFECSWEHKGLSDTAHTMSVLVAGQEVMQQGSDRKVNASPNEVELMALMQWNSCSRLFPSSESHWDQFQLIAALLPSHITIMIDLENM